MRIRLAPMITSGRDSIRSRDSSRVNRRANRRTVSLRRPPLGSGSRAAGSGSADLNVMTCKAPPASRQVAVSC